MLNILIVVFLGFLLVCCLWYKIFLSVLVARLKKHKFSVTKELEYNENYSLKFYKISNKYIKKYDLLEVADKNKSAMFTPAFSNVPFLEVRLIDKQLGMECQSHIISLFQFIDMDLNNDEIELFETIQHFRKGQAFPKSKIIEEMIEEQETKKSIYGLIREND